MINQELEKEIVDLKKNIMEYLGIPSEQIQFEFTNIDSHLKLNLVTTNPIHKQTFLFHSTIGYSKTDCLHAMLNYVRNYKDLDQSYTIQWSLKGSDKLHISYFRASNIIKVLEKFSYGRDINGIVVFSINLNPIS